MTRGLLLLLVFLLQDMKSCRAQRRRILVGQERFAQGNNNKGGNNNDKGGNNNKNGGGKDATTQSPSVSPTRQPPPPTFSPSKSPTRLPTAAPIQPLVTTSSPTIPPTSVPTNVPTREPSRLSANDSTRVPSKEPTRVPTNQPNVVLNTEPTRQPTTIQPSVSPTGMVTIVLPVLRFDFGIYDESNNNDPLTQTALERIVEQFVQVLLQNSTRGGQLDLMTTTTTTTTTTDDDKSVVIVQGTWTGYPQDEPQSIEQTYVQTFATTGREDLRLVLDTLDLGTTSLAEVWVDGQVVAMSQTPKSLTTTQDSNSDNDDFKSNGAIPVLVIAALVFPVPWILLAWNVCCRGTKTIEEEDPIATAVARDCVVDPLPSQEALKNDKLEQEQLDLTLSSNCPSDEQDEDVQDELHNVTTTDDSSTTSSDYGSLFDGPPMPVVPTLLLSPAAAAQEEEADVDFGFGPIDPPEPAFFV